jgi:hypothetical protein
VNRTSTRFGENAAISKQYGALDLSTKWNVDVQKNKTQNNRRQQTGRGTTTLAYELDEVGGWSLGGEFGVSRTNTKSDVNRQVNEDDKLGLFVTTEVLGRALSRSLALGEGVLSWTSTTQFDRTESRDINESRNRTTQALTRADSTDAEGSERSFDSELILAPRPGYSFEMTASVSRASEDFRTDRPLEPDSTRFLSGTNEDEADIYSVKGDYSPDRDTQVGFQVSSTKTRIQEYSTTLKQQDTRYGRDELLSFTAGGKPFLGILLGGSADYRKVRTSYEVSDQGAGRESRGVDGKVLFTFGRGFGLLAGTEVDVVTTYSETQNTYDNSTSYDEDAINIRTVLRRTFGKKLKATLSGEGDLKQTYYDAAPGQVKDDRDVLRRTLDTSWTYAASPRLTTSLNMQLDERQTINISGRKSSANSVETVVQVGATYTWSIRPATSLTQRFNVNANSSTFAFDEDKSNLFRQSRLETEVSTTLAERAHLRLEHEYRARDSGAYTELGPGLPRGYAKDTEEIQQIVEAETTYRILESATAFYRQRYDIRDVTQIVTGTSRTTDLLESIWGVDVNHEFDEQFVFKMKMERTSSNREPSYWKGQASVNRTF